ncbi:MAG: MBG domain-containing protein [Bacteroidales bacterium]|jgi:hypothetical protein|nr:MBG domain-containing protein [Bacteroidales bacterium]
MKQAKIFLSGIICFLFCGIISAQNIVVGSLIAKDVPLHLRDNKTEMVSGKTIDFKVVTLNDTTYVYTFLKGGTIDGAFDWVSHFCFWKGDQKQHENYLVNRYNAVETWGYTLVSAADKDSITIYQNITGAGISETPCFYYNAAVANTPEADDVTAPVLNSYDYDNLVQISATLKFSAADEHDFFYIVTDSASGKSQVVWSDSLPLTGLTPGSSYSYRIVPVDFSGNRGVAGIIRFETPSAIYLTTPTDISITDSTISYTGDANAITHKVSVYRGNLPLLEFTQDIDNESGGYLHCSNLPTGRYTVKVQAVGNEVNIFSSGISTAYEWNFTNDNYTPSNTSTSNICRVANGGVFFTVETENDKLVITISGTEGTYKPAFRNNGFQAEKFKVNGYTGTWFTKESGNAANPQIFKPTIELRAGDVIDYDGTAEWIEPENNNAYDLGFNFNKIGGAYTWGSRCSRLTQPYNFSIDGSRSVTFDDTNNTENIAEYRATVYNRANIAVAVQAVNSGDILAYDVAGGTVTLQAISNNPDISSSDPANYEWEYTNTNRILYPTGFWNTPVDGGSGAGNTCGTYTSAPGSDLDVANYTFETINGQLIITILPGPAGFANFRNEGFSSQAGYSINGGVQGDYFDRTYTANQIILTPKVEILDGDVVSYNGQVLYRTSTYNSGGCGNIYDLYPNINFANFGTYVWGTKGPTLWKPEQINVDENRVLTFEGDENAGSYLVNIYTDSNFPVATQTVAASGETITYDVSGNYYILMQALPKDKNYFASSVSDTFHYTYTNDNAPKYPSIFCGLAFDPDLTQHGDNDRCVITWETKDGNIVISIAADEENGNSETYFRNTGFNANNFSINGITGTYFTIQMSPDMKTVTLTPTVTINPGDQISYNGYLEYRTALAVDERQAPLGLWPTVNFATRFGYFTYGTTCDYYPEVETDKHVLTFSPDTGIQTFVLSAEKLTSPLTVTASRGLSVYPQTLIPDTNGVVHPVDIYVEWAEGSSNGFVQIAGGGLAFPKDVKVRTNRFSEYCNKYFENQGGATDLAPVYLTITEQSETVLEFKISPVYGNTANWNNITNITSDGGQGLDNKYTNGPVITATFGTALVANNVITFGSPTVWTASKADGSTNGNAYVNASQTYIVGQGGCLLEYPSPAVRTEATVEVVDVNRKAISTVLKIAAGGGTYELEAIRIREINGLLPLTTFAIAEDSMYLIEGVTPKTDYNFEIVALDTLGYPSAIATVTLTTRDVLQQSYFTADIRDTVYDGTAHGVDVRANTDIQSSTGAITVIYNDSITTAPINAGEYEVKIAVEQGTGYIADTLIMGTFTIAKRDITVTDLIYDTTEVVYNGTPFEVEVTPLGNIAGFENIDSVFYNGNTAKPVNAGNYTVSVSISEGINHNAIPELVLGTLIVNRATAISADKFSLAAGNTVYDAAPQKAGIIISHTVVGLGAITDTFYNGVADAPDTAGAYHVTVNVAEGANYEAISAISVGTFTINKATPLSSHFEYTPKNIQFDNNPHTVIVSLKNPYTGTGTITVKYNGETTPPSAANTYQISISVTEGKNFLASATDIVLGNFVINEKPLVTAADLSFEITDTVYTGLAHGVSVTSLTPDVGDIAVLYNGSSETPIDAGEYRVSVNISGTETFDETLDLLLGTLIINKAVLSADYLVYSIPDSIEYDGNTHAVEVSLAAPYSDTSVFTVYYNGNIAAPAEANVYEVTLNAAEGKNFLSIENLALGTLKIYANMVVGIEQAAKTELNAYIIRGDMLYITPQVESLQMFNVNGVNVLESHAKGRAVSVSRLPRGLYIAVLKGANGSIKTVKIMK